MEAKKYPVPVYLNHEIALDLLAIMEGGFSTMSSIKVTTKEASESSREGGGSFGITNLFGLVKFDASGKTGKKAGSDHTQEEASERVHTANSLFARLLVGLRSENLIHGFENAHLRAGQFAELPVRLVRSPLLGAFEAFHQVLNMAGALEEKGGQKKPAQAPGQSAKGMQRQVDEILKSLKAGGNVELIGQPTVPGEVSPVVISANERFARDGSFLDIVDGEYHVFGKILRVVRSEDPPINLMRKSAFGALNDITVDELLQQIEGLMRVLSQQGLNVPELRARIPGPAIQLLPIAIYL